MPFTPGNSYTRVQINEVLGGETVSYLPQKDGKIVCGCFSLDSDPEAPFLILVGGDEVYEGHVVEKKARLLTKQGEPIPVFLKRASNDWVFEGLFQLSKATRNRKFLDIKQREAGRSDVVMALIFEPVESTHPYSTYLLTWNPNKWQWSYLEEQVFAITRGHRVDERWSCGTTKKIQAGDRLFLSRQGPEPRGVMAAGWAISGPRQEPHWDPERQARGEECLFVQVRFDRILNPEYDEILTLDRLRDGPLGSVHWNTQTSGIQINHGVDDLERLWAELVDSHHDLDDQDSEAIEGEARLASRRHQKREGWLRNEKIAQVRAENAGRLPCQACGFDFFAAYGETGRDYAQVHHLNPLSDRTKPSSTRLSDLAVLCANCHVMVHRGGKNRSLNGLVKAR